MAAKRVRANDGDQDFGFLTSDGNKDQNPVADSPVFPQEPPTTDEIANVSADADAKNVEPGESQPNLSTTDSFVPQGSAQKEKLATADLKPSTPSNQQPAQTVSAKASQRTKAAAASSVDPDPKNSTAGSNVPPDYVSRKLFIRVAGYAVALTLLFMALLLSGRLSLFGNPTLESLPDLRPLAPNEFRKVPEEASLPDGHVMLLGESRRFGDVVVTPVRVTSEPLMFQAFDSGAPEDKLTTKPVLRLWLTFENVGEYAFPPFDAGLMSHRTPPDSKDESTAANSFLTVGIPAGEKPSTRMLNFLQSMENYFVITGHNAGKVINPKESVTTFVASSEDIIHLKTDDGTSFVWRIQFRKGVNVSSGNGVTTLIDVRFSGADLAAAG